MAQTVMNDLGMGCKLGAPMEGVAQKLRDAGVADVTEEDGTIYVPGIRMGNAQFQLIVVGENNKISYMTLVYYQGNKETAHAKFLELEKTFPELLGLSKLKENAYGAQDDHTRLAMIEMPDRSNPSGNQYITCKCFNPTSRNLRLTPKAQI